MPVSDVTRVATQRVQDGKFSVEDVDATVAAAGGISPDEEAALAKIRAAYQQDGSLEPAAATHFEKLLTDVSRLRTRAARFNRQVEVAGAALRSKVDRLLQAGKATKTFGGTPIPESVKEVVRNALAAGVVVYDVRELKPNPVYDTSHGEPGVILDGKFNPYSQEQKAADTLTFDYTELTPAKIAEDMAQERELPIGRQVPGADGKTQIEVTVKKVKPNGSIRSNYDEASWPVTQARGPNGEKYASNFAILADGSIHAVPWSRRTGGEPWRILTTASLARGELMLFNGHLNMDRGVITYVGLSGRLANMREDGETFVDPIALFKAWGFKVAPGLTVTYE